MHNSSRHFFTTCIFLAPVLAVVRPTVAQQDPQAGKILDAARAKYASLKSFQAGFTQTLENPAAKLKQNTSGDLTMSGQKYHLVSSYQQIISDGTTLWTYDKEDNEVTIIDASESEQEFSLPRVFSFDKEGYKYQFLKSLKQGGVTWDQIELSPEDKTVSVFKMQLLISQADKSLFSAKTFEKNGTRTTFTFKNFKANVPTTQSTFTFDKAAYPGVKVVDSREPKRRPFPPDKPPLFRPQT